MISQKKREIVVIDSITAAIEAEQAGLLKGNWYQDSVTFGPELLDEVILDPTINIFLDKSPKLLIPKDYLKMVKRLHYQRAQFITAEQKRKEPKIEGEE